MTRERILLIEGVFTVIIFAAIGFLIGVTL